MRRFTESQVLDMALYRIDGAHQSLTVRVFNSNGAEADDALLVGVYITGSPACQ